MADPTYVWQPKLERYYTALEDIGAHDGTARTRAKSALRRSKPLKTMALGPLSAGKASDVDWLFTEKHKLTPSQKHKKKNFNKEQSQEMKKRVKKLSEKLVYRIRLIVDADESSDLDNSKINDFREKMRFEAESLKLESFGIEVYCHSCLRKALLMKRIKLLHTIGAVYVSEATSAMKSISRKLFTM